jgi:putative hydrolase of the HAD superfamily
MKKIKNIKYVFFDLYNTLVRFHPDREDTQVYAAKSVNFKVSKNQMKKALFKADSWFASKTAFKSVHLLNKREKFNFFCNYEKEIMKNLNIDISEEQAMNMWQYVYDEKSSLVIYEDVIDCFKFLVKEKYIIGIITNIDSSGVALLNELKLSRYVDKVITSKDANASKPDPKIFNFALEKFDAKASECMFVGDQIETDVKGALKIGMVPMLIDRNHEFQAFDKHLKIFNLKQLELYL